MHSAIANNGWFFPITRIRQLDNHGCGIASVATVCGVTYERARAEFFPNRSTFVDGDQLHVSGLQMEAVIKRLGFDVKHVENPLRQKVPTVFTFPWGNDESWGLHVVVWDPFNKRILDPGPDHDRGEATSFYLKRWQVMRYRSYAVTGRTRT